MDVGESKAPNTNRRDAYRAKSLRSVRMRMMATSPVRNMTIMKLLKMENQWI
jgi:hypothetical protein